MSRFSFETELRGALAIVALHGELDVLATAALESELERLACEPGIQGVALDLRALDFLDANGLRTLVAAGELLEANGRRLVLVRGDERVQRVLRITRLDERLEIVDSADAVA